MAKMRYSDAPDWSYGGRQHPVKIKLTTEQVRRAIKRVPSYKMGTQVQDYLKALLGRGQFGWWDEASSWDYVRKKDGSTWLIGHTSFVNRCFEIPPTIAKRFEKLNELMENW